MSVHQTKSEQRIVVIITRNLPPKIGGMERLNELLIDGLSKRYPIVVICSKGSKINGQPNVEYIECPIDSPLLYLLQSLVVGITLAPKYRHKVKCVIATSGLYAPVAKIVSFFYQAKLVTFVHGLDLIVQSTFYRLVFLPFVRKSETIIANSANTAKLARSSGIGSSSIIVVNPCIDFPKDLSIKKGDSLFNFDPQDPVILSVGRLVKRKGVQEFVEKSLPALVREYPELRFVVVGEEPSSSLRTERGVLKTIKNSIEKHSLQKNVILTGPVSNEELRKAYISSNVFVFPLIAVKGDVEGFGMVAVEAAAHGLPTVAFNEGGIADAVMDGVTGFLIEKDDYESFNRKVIELIKTKDGVKTKSLEDFSRKFTPERYCKQVMNVLEEEVP